MSFIERTLSLVKKKGITKNKLLTDLELGKNSFVDWGENGNLPNGATIIKIANYFGVTADYLLTGKEYTGTDSFLQPDESKLLTDYRTLSDQGKEFMHQVMVAALNTYKKDHRVSGMETAEEIG